MVAAAYKGTKQQLMFHKHPSGWPPSQCSWAGVDRQDDLTLSSLQKDIQEAQLTPLMYAVAILRISNLKGCSRNTT